MKILKTIAFLALATMSTLPTMGQDLLARQAPIDRKMKAVDSVALQRLIETETFYESPSADLYDDWDNMHAHSHATVLPDSFRISLKNFCMPTTSRVLTSNFGARWGRQHKGLDIKVYIGDTIRAAFDGKVRVVRYEGRGYGKYVVIRHDNGLETYYAHMSKRNVVAGQQVKSGDVIGLCGNTGRSRGSHLHFEIRYMGNALNPEDVLDCSTHDLFNDELSLTSSSFRKVAKGGKAGSKTSSGSGKASNGWYRVRSGDTLEKIARRNGTTVTQLCKLNGISRNKILHPGDKLRVSGKATKK